MQGTRRKLEQRWKRRGGTKIINLTLMDRNSDVRNEEEMGTEMEEKGGELKSSISLSWTRTAMVADGTVPV
jgi:hypothetical protein